METLPKVKVNEYRLYISDNIGNLNINYRREILQMLIYAVDDEKLIEKGNGTQIKFTDLDDKLLTNIYNFIYNKIENGGDIF
jgi:hypothetical protein